MNVIIVCETVIPNEMYFWNDHIRDFRGKNRIMMLIAFLTFDARVAARLNYMYVFVCFIIHIDYNPRINWEMLGKWKILLFNFYINCSTPYSDFHVVSFQHPLDEYGIRCSSIDFCEKLFCFCKCMEMTSKMRSDKISRTNMSKISPKRKMLYKNR